MYIPYRPNPLQTADLPRRYEVGDKLRFKGKTHQILKENEIVSISFVAANNYYQVRSLTCKETILVLHYMLGALCSN